MALRPIKPGEHDRPDTPEEHARYKADLAEADATPENWGNDPVVRQARADAARVAAVKANEVADSQQSKTLLKK